VLPEGRLVIRALLIDGHVYPSAQLPRGRPDRCDALHWHKDRRALSIGTPSTVATRSPPRPGSASRRDPDPSACGFGRVRQLPSTDSTTTQACYEPWRTAELAVR
jgi:hypothetical protein